MGESGKEKAARANEGIWVAVHRLLSTAPRRAGLWSGGSVNGAGNVDPCAGLIARECEELWRGRRSSSESDKLRVRRLLSVVEGRDHVSAAMERAKEASNAGAFSWTEAMTGCECSENKLAKSGELEAAGRRRAGLAGLAGGCSGGWSNGSTVLAGRGQGNQNSKTEFAGLSSLAGFATGPLQVRALVQRASQRWSLCTRTAVEEEGTRVTLKVEVGRGECQGWKDDSSPLAYPACPPFP